MSALTVYQTRRAHLIAQMQALGGGVAIQATAPEVLRNGDASYPYRHDSSFYYLSGFDEPEALLVLIAPREGCVQSILFCREKNPERKIWEGFHHGPALAKTRFGFDAAFPLEALSEKMPDLLQGRSALFLCPRMWEDARLKTWLATVAQRARKTGLFPPGTRHALHRLLDEMRLLKDAHEITLLKRAAEISVQAHMRAMHAAHAGVTEQVLEAEILHSFYAAGSVPAYGSIVASGANACVLHYRANNQSLKSGECVLIDAGCEFQSYAADITRTFPVDGHFSAAQKNLYEIVLAAQQAAIAAIEPGASFETPHNCAIRILVAGMLELGLLKKNIVGSVEDAIEKKAYLPFYMHKTSHWLGMDVHDCGSYFEPAHSEVLPRKLQPGMLLTVEPGLYVRPDENIPEIYWNTGIPIEDDVLVTPEKPCNLTEAAPRAIADIEALMRG